MSKGEMHLLIIWEHARYQQQRIIDDLKNQFEIIDCYEIEWTKKSVANNFTRFYGVNLPNRSFKERECGRGKFILLILWDANPIYEARDTSRGKEVVNTKMFDNKSKYRSWTKGGHKIHATNSPQETNHDLTLLLGINYEDFLKKNISKRWSGLVNSMHRDLSGEHGWKSLNEFFYVLNNTISYVLMRGEENLTAYKLDDHGDIDLLVNEWQNAIYIMNGEQLYFFSPYRPKVLVVTELEGEFLFDLWNSHLSYHSKKWHENMFSTREYNGLYYKLNEENDFYTLLYHCLVHKDHIASDYMPRFEKHFNNLGLNKKYSIINYKNLMDMYYDVLYDYMKENSYEFLYAKEDYHCFYNERTAMIAPALENLKRNTELSNIKPYKVGEYSISGYLYFTAEYKTQKVFIKYNGVGDSCENEYILGKRVYQKSSAHFVEPLLYFKKDNIKYLIFKWIEGESLSSYSNHSNSTRKDNIKTQLIEIYDVLQDTHIMHRDIRPDNFLVVNGCLKLIDFQFSIDSFKREELSYLKTNPSFAKGIGDKRFKYGEYSWRDSFSFLKVMESLGIDTSNVNLKKDKPYYMDNYVKYYINSKIYPIYLFMMRFLVRIKNYLYKCLKLLQEFIPLIKAVVFKIKMILKK